MFPLAGTTAKTLRRNDGWVSSKLPIKANPGQIQSAVDRRGDLVKILYWDGQGFCLFAKRLEKGRFTWPVTKEGAVSLSPAQLSMLLEGLEWRTPQRTWAPTLAG